MTEQGLYVLAALCGGDLHGYAIAREVEELSGGEVKLSAGTLYGAVSRLCEQGLIEQTREESVGGRRRRYYRLTPLGAEELSREGARLRTTARVLNSRAALVAGLRPGAV